ncbi:zinc finger protein 648-like [Osmerus mordax]|uniref:zinc finger protein 648-like n=1 Tax=Osmerus mordax TaxID=8014 RepID=UPI0035108E2A
MSIKLKSHREMNEMAMHMPNSKAMHDQLVIIMGALTKAAVAEICEIVDEGYAVLHLEISKRHKENEDLKKKLHLIESIIARGNASSQAPNVASTDAVSLSRDATCTKHRQNNNGENVNDDGKITPGDGYLMEREEFPDVVLIKDEDSDNEANEESKDGAKVTKARPQAITGGREGSSPGQFRNKIRNWPGNDTEGNLQLDLRKKTSKQTFKRSAPKINSGNRKTMGSPFTLRAASNEPGCSGQLEGDEMAIAESSHSYSSDTAAEGLLVHPDHPDCSPVSDINTNSQVYFEAQGEAMIDSEPNKLELDLCSPWPKQRNSDLDFTRFHQSENDENEAFGLKLISVSGATTTHCPLSSEINTSMDFDGSDLMAFTVYDEQSSRLQHGEVQAGAIGKGRRFICRLCNKHFATSQNLEVHMRIHTGERPFSCAQCGKRFTQSAHLKSHLNIHTGERPHACGICGKSFIVKYSMKLHMKKCHSNV